MDDEINLKVIPKLRSWNPENIVPPILRAKSFDGKFFALKADTDDLFVIHNKINHEEKLLEDCKDFIWSECKWRDGNDLTIPNENCFLIALDGGSNIILFELCVKEDQSYSCSLITVITSSVVLQIEDIDHVENMVLISSSHNNAGTNLQVFCLVNRLFIVELLISVQKEPKVGRFIKVSEEDVLGSNKIFISKKKDDLLYLLSENLSLFIFRIEKLECITVVSLQERLILYEVCHFDITKSDPKTVVFLDESLQLHFLKFQEISPTTTKQKSDKKFLDLWNYRLNCVKTRNKVKKCSVQTESNSSSLFTVPPEYWMNDYKVIQLTASTGVIIMLVQPKNKTCEERYLITYDIEKNKFQHHAVPLETCLAISNSSLYPTLLISKNALSILLYDTSQEQLIDTVIQFSDINQAEMICKSNNWDQFSIPLHTLQVGLQHRQLDTIAFFLKSREKVFTRYWKSVFELSLSINVSNSPSKSFSSQKSFGIDIDSDEMMNAILMLMNAVDSNSSGKHKQSFFEGLTSLALSYLNNLIQDGVAALNLKSTNRNLEYAPSRALGKSASQQQNKSSQIHNFHFLQDIPDAMKFITEKIIELRGYMNLRKLPTKQVYDAMYGPLQKNTMELETVEELLLSGNIPSLQKLLFSRSDVCKGTFGDVLGFGVDFVKKQLKEEKIVKAEQILLNLGLNPKEEIKNIYLNTLDRSLRKYLNSYLKNNNCLNQEDTADYSYVQQVEEVYNTEEFMLAAQMHNYTWSDDKSENEKSKEKETHTYAKFSLVHVSSWSEDMRKQIIVEGQFIRDAIDKIKTEDNQQLWDFLLSRNNLEVLLTWLSSASKENQQEKTDFQFLQLPDTLMTSDTTLPKYSKDVLLHRLVQLGFYPDFLLEDMKLLINYITANNMLFTDPHPIQFYKRNINKDQRKELTNRFNKEFISYCAENDLLMLLLKFIFHYEIDYAEILVSDELKSWVSFLINFHEMFKKKGLELEKPLMFNSLVENARFLNFDEKSAKDGQYGLNDIVKSQNPIMALSIALVCNLSVDQLFPDNNARSVYSIEKSLLNDALRMHPKIYAALFSHTEEVESGKEVSMYRLLQDNTNLDVRHWFGWQSDNDVIIKDENMMMELPHFSNHSLVQRYSLEVNLSYDYYLLQARPMFAYILFMKEIAKDTVLNDADREAAFQVVYKLGVENYLSPPVSSSCVLFMEFLDGPSDLLKIDINAACLISKHWLKKANTINGQLSPEELKTLLVSLLLSKKNKNLLKIKGMLEESIEIMIQETNSIRKFSYEAVCRWHVVARFCQLHDLPLTTVYVRACCEEGDWMQFILFIHLYQMPQQQVLAVLENTPMTNKPLKEHLIAVVKKAKKIPSKTESKNFKLHKEKLRVITETNSAPTAPIKIKGHPERDVRGQFYLRLGASMVTAKDSASSGIVSTDAVTDPVTSTPKKNTEDEEGQSAEPSDSNTAEIDVLNDTKLPDIEKIPDSIVDILLECDNHATPWKKLLAYAVALFHPFLAVLASSHEDANQNDCLCIWYICSVDEKLRLKICQSLIDLDDKDALIILRSRRWLPDDLLVITKCILSDGIKYTKLLSQGFIIFKKTNPLLFLPQFLETFLYDSGNPRTRAILEEFQKEYQNYRDPNVLGKSFATEQDVYLCEEFSLQCVMQVINDERMTTYHIYKLVTYLADAKYGFMFNNRNAPDFLLAKKTADIAYSTGINFSIKRLCIADEDKFQVELQSIFDSLLMKGYFEEAHSFTNLHGFSDDQITVRKHEQELDEISQTDSWKNVEVRTSFWKQTSSSFQQAKCSPQPVALFFQKQAERKDSIYSNNERAMLLLIAIQWCKSLPDIDYDQIHHMERSVWAFRIKAVKENQSVKDPINSHYLLKFSFDASVNTSTNSSVNDVIKTERKCSDVADVRDISVTELLQNQDIDIPLSNFEDDAFTLEDEEEEKAFKLLIGNLLDDGHVTEARRVSHFFKRTTPDLDIVITSILLAQGRLTVERCSDNIKAMLAETTSRHISVSGMLELSGSFTRPESLTRNSFTGGNSDVMVDFVFIEEVQNALEKLTLRVNHGKKCCQQILICFKIAKILGTSYEEIVTDDCLYVLRRVLETKLDHRRQLSKQFIKAFALSADEVAIFLSNLVISWIKVITGVDEFKFEHATLKSVDEQSSPKEDDVISLVHLTESSAVLGNKILEEAMLVAEELTRTERRDIARLSCLVELLICSHYCFTITCDMEGIAGVLRTAHYCTECLSKGNQYSLMVRLLTGIGRFREMFYVMETLYNQQHFEQLCRKHKGGVKENQLKMALLEFISRNHPEDTEVLNMISACFGMYRESAEHFEKRALSQVERVKLQIAEGGKDFSSLEEIRNLFLYAAENYSKEECLHLKHKCTRLAHLAKLQMQLLASGQLVLGLSDPEVKEFLNNHTDFIEALIVADSYEMLNESVWIEPIYKLVILKGNFTYLDQYQKFFQLSPALVTSVAVKFRSERSNQSPNYMKKFLKRLRDVKVKMKIARELNFTDIEKQIIEGPMGVFLRDHTF